LKALSNYTGNIIGKELVDIGFSYNQYMNQELVSIESIVEACKENFGVTFQLTEKVDINGPDIHPVFEYQKKNLKGVFGKK
jgi:glutathione peroxidase